MFNKKRNRKDVGKMECKNVKINAKGRKQRQKPVRGVYIPRL
jgi:hypothetical protein